MSDTEIQDTPVDREAVRMIAEVLGRPPRGLRPVADYGVADDRFDTAPIDEVEAAWRALSLQLLNTEIEVFNGVEEGLTRLASGPSNLAAEAGARALDLYALVVDFRFDPAFTGKQEIYRGAAD